MKPTLKKAKKIVNEVWTYLAEHPEIAQKRFLPRILYNKIKYYGAECPYCELYFDNDYNKCPLAVLGKYCMDKGSLYDLWDFPEKYNPKNPTLCRSRAALAIAKTGRR